MKKAVVIGAGVGGLAVAIRLARKGWEVEIFEASGVAGGKLAQIRGNGYRFDAGPSLFTLPDLTNELLDNDLQLETVQLPVVTRYFWNDGLELDAHADAGKFCDEAGAKCGADSRRLRQYFSEAGRLYDAIAPVFLFNSLHRLKSLITGINLRALLYLPRLRAFTSLHKYNLKKTGNPKLVQLLDRYATYNGSDPYQTPATLRVIAHLEHNLGAYLPAGGMFSITEALVSQAHRQGVRFRFNEPVREVLHQNGRVTGIVTDSGTFHSDIVVSNADIFSFYSTLLPDNKRLRKLQRQQLSTSALIFYLGIRGTYPGLEVHNIFFSDDYRAEFECLFRKDSIYHDPTVYVYISSKLFPSDAPEECGNWFVMVNAPENKGQYNEDTIRIARAFILGKLEKFMGTTLEDKIEFEEVLDPVKIESRTGSWHGSLYGPSSNDRMSAFKRHPNFSGTLRGLYFTGGSVHPGGGIPLCLSSARIVSSLVEKDTGR